MVLLILYLHELCVHFISILMQGADINYPVSDGEPAWVSLVKSGFNVLLEILLNSGFNPNVQDAHGNTRKYFLSSLQAIILTSKLILFELQTLTFLPS